MQNLHYRIRELQGRSMMRIPNPPRSEYLPARLSECSQISGEQYLLAGELFSEPTPSDQPFDHMLGFWYGGTNEVRYARDWISAVERGIALNGIFEYRIRLPPPHQRGKPSTECFPTNSCAIIRDSKGIVKIVPIQFLRRYADAGLVRLPSPQMNTQ